MVIGTSDSISFPKVVRKVKGENSNLKLKWFDYSSPLPFFKHRIHLHRGSLVFSLKKSLNIKSIVPFTLVNTRTLNLWYSNITFMIPAVSAYHLYNIYLIPKSAPFLVNLNNLCKKFYSMPCHSNHNFQFSNTNQMPHNSNQF